jgi:hypothetical protein
MTDTTRELYDIATIWGSIVKRHGPAYVIYNCTSILCNVHGV